MAGFGDARRAAYDGAQRTGAWRATFAGLTAWERHQQLLSHLSVYGGGGGGASSAADPAAALAGTRTDADVLRESYRFIRRPEDDAPGTWEARLAARYYARLFREFAIADLSRYKEQKVGLRWRTEAEVAAGKGQFICGARGCASREGLASYELLFRYAEAGEDKCALVKVRVCTGCAAKLAYGRGGGALKRAGGSGRGGDRGGSKARQRSRSRSRSRSRERARSKSSKGGRRRRRSRSRGGSSSDSSSGSERSGSRSRSHERRRHSSGKRDRKRRSSKRRSRSRSRSTGGSRERRRNRAVEGGSGSRGGAGGSAAGPTDAEMNAWLDEMFAADQ